ncbi:PREDICTED: uncharacterized protein LOC106324063 [Brassica oleracea var. oleracea]|uniref:uncharacterized protein LOC106324063 n=1 Tax=Brassica oleracea var. oleracea TaxID=109376 RepID=UPI0006A6F378|nr:PREDICTED: uncharacterized protein LOC106324063 [Brassica oleracea var. oleracea]
MGDHGNQDDLTAALAIIQQQMQTQQQQMLQMQQTIQNQQQDAQEAAESAAREERGAPIGERNLPRNFATNRSPINHPPCTRQDYEIKPALISLVRSAFLSHFYMKSKTAALWHLTSNFKQKSDKPFHEAWERYKEYQRECPHHGFDDDYILEVFYDGVSYEFRNTLDSLSNGDFMTQTTPGAFGLIENMASSSLNKNKEHDHSKSVNSIDDLAAKVDQLLKGNQSQVFIMEEAAPEKSVGDPAFDAEISGDDQQEVSYANGQGWQLQNYHPNPNVRHNPQLFWPKQDKPADPAQSNQGQYAGSPRPEQPAEAVRPIPKPVPAREYTPKVPYPVPAKDTRNDREEMKCRKMLEDLTVRLPLMDAIQMMPSMRSFMKGLISGKISEGSEFMTVSKECSAVLQNRQIKKRGDPG